MGKNPSEFKGKNLPVERVSWYEAVEFCVALNKKERKAVGKFALPTEAQWEYACRAGTTTAYSWGNNITPQLANYGGSGLKKSVEVGSYIANPWGFFDLHGNVWEWTADSPLLIREAQLSIRWARIWLAPCCSGRLMEQYKHTCVQP